MTSAFSAAASARRAASSARRESVFDAPHVSLVDRGRLRLLRCTANGQHAGHQRNAKYPFQHSTLLLKKAGPSVARGKRTLKVPQGELERKSDAWRQAAFFAHLSRS
jgi:hypothetical protein